MLHTIDRIDRLANDLVAGLANLKTEVEHAKDDPSEILGALAAAGIFLGRTDGADSRLYVHSAARIQEGVVSWTGEDLKRGAAGSTPIANPKLYLTTEGDWALDDGRESIGHVSELVASYLARTFGIPMDRPTRLAEAPPPAERPATNVVTTPAEVAEIPESAEFTLPSRDGSDMLGNPAGTFYRVTGEQNGAPIITPIRVDEPTRPIDREPTAFNQDVPRVQRSGVTPPVVRLHGLPSVPPGEIVFGVDPATGASASYVTQWAADGKTMELKPTAPPAKVLSVSAAGEVSTPAAVAEPEEGTKELTRGEASLLSSQFTLYCREVCGNAWYYAYNADRKLVSIGWQTYETFRIQLADAGRKWGESIDVDLPVGALVPTRGGYGPDGLGE